MYGMLSGSRDGQCNRRNRNKLDKDCSPHAPVRFGWMPTHARNVVCAYGLSIGPTEGLSTWWPSDRLSLNSCQQRCPSVCSLWAEQSLHSVLRSIVVKVQYDAGERLSCVQIMAQGASEMTYIVSGGALNSTHSLTLTWKRHGDVSLRWLYTVIISTENVCFFAFQNAGAKSK